MQSSYSEEANDFKLDAFQATICAAILLNCLDEFQLYQQIVNNNNKDTAPEKRDFFRVLVLTIRTTAYSLMQDKNYKILKQVLKAFLTHSEEATILKLTLEEVNQSLTTNFLEIQQDNDAKHTYLEQLTVEVGQLKDVIINTKEDYQIKCDYLKKFLQAQCEFHDYRLSKTEGNLSKEILKTRIECYEETRKHQEIVYYLEEVINEQSAVLTKWQNRYNEDVSNLDEQIHKVDEKVEFLRCTRVEITDLMRTRQNQMDSYRGYKEAKRREAELIRRRVQAAICIQNWWRRIIFKLTVAKLKRNKQLKVKRSFSTVPTN